MIDFKINNILFQNCLFKNTWINLLISLIWSFCIIKIILLLRLIKTYQNLFFTLSLDASDTRAVILMNI